MKNTTLNKYNELLTLIKEYENFLFLFQHRLSKILSSSSFLININSMKAHEIVTIFFKLEAGDFLEEEEKEIIKKLPPKIYDYCKQQAYTLTEENLLTFLLNDEFLTIEKNFTSEIMKIKTFNKKFSEFFNKKVKINLIQRANIRIIKVLDDIYLIILNILF